MEGPEVKVESEAPKAPAEAPMEFVLILASEYRIMLERECRAAKRGKSRKLTNKDKEAIAEKVRLMKFDPERMMEQAMEKMLPRDLLSDDEKEKISASLEAAVADVPEDAVEVAVKGREELMQAVAPFTELEISEPIVIGEAPLDEEFV